MELLIVISCGVFFLATAIVAYIRQSKDFDEALKKKRYAETFASAHLRMHITPSPWLRSEPAPADRGRTCRRGTECP